jgi:trehalose 6-phosphate phosphatase
VFDVAAMIDALVERPLETALLVDYDGSLAPIVDHPDAAVAFPGAIDALGRLVGRLARVGIVSGRTVEFLARQVPVPDLVLAGLYGLEMVVGGDRQVSPAVAAYGAAVASAADEADVRLPGVVVERKAGLSVTLHWRMTPQRADAVIDVASDLAARYGLASFRTRFAVELRPPVAIDKGTAVDVLTEGCSIAAFVGDDVGDIAAFEALARAERTGRLRRGVRVGVRSSEMPDALPAAVEWLVDGPAGVVEFLDALGRRLGG